MPFDAEGRLEFVLIYSNQNDLLLTRRLSISLSAAVCLPAARYQNAAVATPTASFDNAVCRQAHCGLSFNNQYETIAIDSIVRLHPNDNPGAIIAFADKIFGLRIF
jgi:hypothetical protein